MNEKAALCLVLVATAAACNKTGTAPPPADAQTSEDGGPRDGGAREAPREAARALSLPDAAALPALPTVTGSGRFAMPGRAEAAIEVVLPEHRPAKPALLIAFHATGEEPANIVEAFDLVAKAEPLGFVAVAPRAGYRGTPHPPDVDHPANWGDSSWNMWSARADANEDLLYVRALIEAAKRSWGVDTTRVYTAGFSNGAYFSYFVAASMPDRIAGFAANSGGWATDACPTRTDGDGNTLYAMSANAPAGKETTCASIVADRRFPSKCRVTQANKLRGPAPGARVPFGYLAHYSGDDAVSVVWSCLLAEGLGARGRAKIRSGEADGTAGHAVMPGFIDGAFKFFAGRTNGQ